MNDAQQYRERLLGKFAGNLNKMARGGILYGTIQTPKAIGLRGITPIVGPRAGGLQIDAGLYVEKVYERLTHLDGALLRQFIPWSFQNAPMVYMDGKYVRIDVNWPDQIADRDIPLYSLGTHPRTATEWIVGKSDAGTTIVTGFSDDKPGYLVGGDSGSGKSEALVSVAAQLTGGAWQSPHTMQLVLIDGKGGEGLGRCVGLPNVVGPLALTPAQCKAALAWCVRKMKERYDAGFSRIPAAEKRKRGPIVVIIDEVQNFAKDDEGIADLLRRLVTEGRAAWVHPVIATQNPKVEYLGDSTTRFVLAGRIGLWVPSYYMSKAIFDASEPRADYLSKPGDSFVRTPNATRRVQWAYIPDTKLSQMRGAEPMFDEWPAVNMENLAFETEGQRRNWQPKDLAVSITHASRSNNGRPSLKRRLNEAGCDVPGSAQASRLMQLGRDVYDEMQRLGYCLTGCEDTQNTA